MSTFNEKVRPMWAVYELADEHFQTRSQAKIRLRKAVLQVLAFHADPDGTNAYPSTATIAKYTAYSQRNVWRALEDLSEIGLIRIESKAGRSVYQSGQNRGKTNRYALTLPKLSAQETSSPSEESTDESNSSYAKSEQSYDKSDSTYAKSDSSYDKSGSEHGKFGIQPPLDRPKKPPIKEEALSSSEDVEAKAADIKDIVREISFQSDGLVAFDPALQKRLGGVIRAEGYMKTDVMSAFKGFFQYLDTDDTKAVRYAAKGFVDTADALMDTARRKRLARERDEANIARARLDLERKAKEEREEHARKKAEEEALIEEWGTLTAD